MEEHWKRIGECLRHGYHPAISDLRAAFAQVWPDFSVAPGVRCTKCGADGCGACQQSGWQELPAWMQGESNGGRLD